MIAKDLKLLLSEKSDIVLIDLLPPEHFDKVHIPSAKMPVFSLCLF
jgi:rhodanese-related sulfurtransferase